MSTMYIQQEAIKKYLKEHLSIKTQQTPWSNDGCGDSSAEVEVALCFDNEVISSDTIQI